MKDGTCPKCGSEEVYVDSTRHGIIVPVTAFTQAQTHLYLCADCGYMEFYAQTGFDLQKIKERFRKAKS